MKTPHKHAEVTIAWLNDQSIKLEYSYEGWLGWAAPREGINPITHPDHNWRIKPEPKPDTVRYYNVLLWRWREVADADSNLKLTYCGETGKLKAAEVIS